MLLEPLAAWSLLLEPGSGERCCTQLFFRCKKRSLDQQKIRYLVIQAVTFLGWLSDPLKGCW